MATPPQIRAAVDAKLVTIWTAIQTKQNSYAASHNGRFWQGLRTHAINPADGLTVLPDIGVRCPTDQLGQPWPNAVLTLPIEMAIQVDCYDGPLGTGYQATIWIVILANVWTRTTQVGPETWRTSGWAQIVTP